MLDDTGAGRFLNGLVLGMALFGVSGAMRAETQAAGQGLSPTVVGPEVLNRLYPSVEIQDQGVTTTAIQDRMAALHAPGMSVAVIQGGRLAWAQGFGLTRQGGPAVTVNTLFQAGSVSKMLTAIAVLTLVEQGKLDLDRDVNQYLRSWKIPANEFTKARKVTLRMLLTHTGGINNGVRFFPRSVKRLPTITQILQGSGPAANSYKITVDHIPGTAWSYANGGYDIIQQLLEDVTGQPYDRFMAATVLEPLGMARSSYVEPLPEARLAEAATAHEISGA
ncbi:MAG TPA: serine hydrolase domain-containing protein, partial [bacterium]|nr:serine hydrolase domain-containing protein [bacterium]